MSCQPPAWVEPWLGKPFARGSAGPEAFDCYGLVRAVLRDRYGLEAPEHGATPGPDGSPWREIDAGEGRGGDVLVFDDGRELHVAVVVDSEWMLHAREGRGVTLGRWRRDPWVGTRIGAYRLEASCAPR